METVVRTQTNAASFAPALRETLHRMDTGQLLEKVRTLKAVINEQMTVLRVVTRTMATFGILALALSITCVYALKSSSAQARSVCVWLWARRRGMCCS